MSLVYGRSFLNASLTTTKVFHLLYTDVCTDSSDSEDSDVSIQEDIQKDATCELPCVDAIKNATLVLVEFGKTTKRCSNKYRYAAIC